MLLQVEIKNFKRLRDVRLDLSKINVLVGPNGSGKSSVIQLLALLKQSAEGVNYNGEYVELGSFADVVYKHLMGTSVDVTFSFPLSKDDVDKLSRTLETLEFLRVDRRRVERGAKLSFRVSWRGDEFEKQAVFIDKWLLVSGSKRSAPLETDFVVNKDVQITTNPRRMAFWGAGGPSNAVDEVLKISEVVRKIVVSKLNKVYPLLVTRGITRYSYDLTTSRPPEVGSRDIEKVGSNAANTLMYMLAAPPAEVKLEEIANWASRFGVKIRPRLLGQHKVAVEGHDSQLDIWSNMVLQGFGASQLLPVIVQGLTAPSDSTLMVEEPEIHLHPRYQAELVDLFIAVSKENRQVLISTHSEHIILRLQRRVAEGKLRPDDFTIYYFDNAEGDTKVVRIEVDEYGGLKTWFPGFFEEGFEESLAHLKASLEKARSAQ